MTSPPLLGRKPERSGHIVRELRGRITNGDLAPGVQLPTRIEIAQHFNASSETVQRALEELRRDGFVTVKGRQGTFVSAQPPHLTNYALVFSPVRGNWNRFFAALDQEAPLIARRAGRQISCYYGIDNQNRSEDYQRLMHDVKAHRLGGIIFTSVPSLIHDTPCLDEPGIPRVAIMTPVPHFKLPCTTTDGASFWQRSTDLLVKQGCKRVALITPPLGAAPILKIRQGLEEHGLHAPTKWCQMVSNRYAEAGRNLTELLFDNRRDRPDALIISDDNLVEHSLAGLLAAGVRVPEDVEVITHCNFPHPVPSVLPVHRLGYDARRVLQSCFDNLDWLRAGEEVPQVTLIPAQFENELPEESGDE